MASERSLYNKIFIILKIANSYDSEKLDNLVEYIRNDPPDIFKTYQYNEKLDDFALTFSEKVFNRILNLCKSLNLLDDKYKITELGKKASDVKNFNKILVIQLDSLFKLKEIKIDELNNIILRCLKAEPPIMPTANEIWKIAKLSIPLKSFSQYINLLYYCKGALVSQKKIYLGIHF